MSSSAIHTYMQAEHTANTTEKQDAKLAKSRISMEWERIFVRIVVWLGAERTRQAGACLRQEHA